METTIRKIKTFNFVTGLAIMALAFLFFPFRDAIVIIFVYNTIVGIISFVTGFFPLIGQIGYFLLVKYVFIPAFFNSWFPEINHIWYTDMIFWFGMVSSVLYSIVLITIISYCRNSDISAEDLKNKHLFNNW
ncbi:MAG TPA: hypothetical protein PKW80_00705 [Bacteroidales bacterium]|nr:hypothetical protein [Bacteroidales bacterium]